MPSSNGRTQEPYSSFVIGHQSSETPELIPRSSIMDSENFLIGSGEVIAVEANVVEMGRGEPPGSTLTGEVLQALLWVLRSQSLPNQKLERQPD